MVPLFAAMSCSGAITYSGLQNLSIPANVDGIYINPISGESGTTPILDLNSAPWLNLLFGGTVIGSSTLIQPVIAAPATGDGDGLVIKLAALTEIGPALNYAAGENGSENHVGSGTNQFAAGESGYMGFAARTVAGGPVFYGWLRMTISGTGSGTVHDWAYENTPGASILAGSVPEPGPALLMLVATGAFGFVRRR